MKKKTHFNVDYDRIGDVLYITSKDVDRTKNEENEAGLVLRYDLATHTPVGATIVDYKEYWLPKRKTLVRRLAKFFDMTLEQTEKAIHSVR